MLPYCKTFAALLIFTVYLSPAFAQSFSDYEAIQNNEAKEKLLVDAIKNQYDKDIASVTGPHKKYIIDLYKERLEFLKLKFSFNEIITSDKATAYLGSLVNEILKNNPDLNTQSLRILFSRAPWPNAGSLGEGTILFNIGLFNRLNNESQAVFVLCHELAHYYLNHSNNNIQQYVNTIYSDDFQKQLKKIQKSEYLQGSQLDKLTMGLMFKSRRHNREFEQSADSMALELMKNTSADIREALTGLALLDSVDKDKYDTDLDLQKHFNFIGYPFQNRWLEQEDFLVINNEKEEKEKTKIVDSLKTHPDCKVRIGRITENVNKYYKPNTSKFIVNEKEFLEFKETFDFEIIEYCYKAGHLSLCMYYALEMLHFYPDNAYLHAIIGKCFNNFYTYQKNHQLGNFVDLPNPKFENRYNMLLNFIQNLRLQDIAALSYYFLHQDANRFATNEDFLYALIISKENFNKQEEKKHWLSIYKTNFPNGKYTF
jgi:Zn-dependent protease with chaperone function